MASSNANNELPFEECYRGPKKEYKLNKPEPSYCYMFRIAALNDLGIR